MINQQVNLAKEFASLDYQHQTTDAQESNGPPEHSTQEHDKIHSITGLTRKSR